jgi:hypothetical protein
MRWARIYAHRLSHMRSGQHPKAAGRTLPGIQSIPARNSTPISNRHEMQLEIAATHTKHSPALLSNRHIFDAFFTTKFRATGQHRGVRRPAAALPPSSPHSNAASPRTQSDPHSPTASHALPGVRQLAAAPPRRRPPLTAASSTASSPNPAVSNRNLIGLEFPVTSTKQSPTPFSNRN